MLAAADRLRLEPRNFKEGAASTGAALPFLDPREQGGTTK
jgi:hypothetical protein